jgi:hypothetical protein
MKGIVSVLAVLSLAGTAYAQQPQVYTPSGSDVTVPTFMNANVVRVDPAGRTITVRADNKDTVLVVEGEGLAALSRLRPGDQVMLGYRVDGGRHVVTNVREVAPTPTSTATGPARSTTIESVRVVAVNPSKRTLTVRDAAGTRHVLTTTTEVGRALRGLRVGDDVVLSYRAGKGNARTVVRIEPVGVGASGTVTQVAPVVPVSTVVVPANGPAVVPATGTNVPVVVTQAGLPATGGIPVPSNAPGAPAQMQPVPNVGPPTSPTLNVALPPATTAVLPENATAAQVDALRSQGIRDLQSAAGVLALKANENDGLWFAFKNLCLNNTTPSGANTTTGREWFVLLSGGTIQQPSDDACRQRLVDLNRCADLFQEQLTVARDAARRSGVEPGTIREILQRNRIDQ